MAPPAPKPAPKRRPRKRNRRVASDSSDSDSSDDSSDSDASADEAPLVPALLAAAAQAQAAAAAAAAAATLVDKGKGKELDAATQAAQNIAAAIAAREAESSGSESDDSSSSDEDDNASTASGRRRRALKNTATTSGSLDPNLSTRIIRPPRKSTSPSPPPSAIPAFLPFDKPPSFLPKALSTSKDDVAARTETGTDVEREEEDKKKRFREFWMGKLVEGFGEDLDVVREEPTLTTPRLTLLINSLTSGIDVFSTGRPTSTSAVGEGGASGTMEIDERDVVLGRI